jgi:hypothetical protein
MSTAPPEFLALQVYSTDDHFGEDRPVAVLVRMDQALHDTVASALRQIQQGALVSVSLALKDDDVRWIKTIGFTSENGLAQVHGAGRSDPAWMPQEAVVSVPGSDLMERDLDGETADYRDDCVVYDSQKEPLLGLSKLELTRFDPRGRGVRSDSPIYLAVHGCTRSWTVDTFLARADLVWPELVREEEADRPRERQTA